MSSIAKEDNAKCKTTKKEKLKHIFFITFTNSKLFK